MTPNSRRLHLKCCRARRDCTATELNRVIFSNESRFNLSNDDNHFLVWWPRGELLNPSFAVQRHTAPTTGVMVWGPIAYDLLKPLIFIHGTITAHRYDHDILQSHVLPLTAGLPVAIFQQNNARPYTARMTKSDSTTVPSFLDLLYSQIFH
ncbi:transposable element Tcb2 transposase [Trichonephila clavipes]|nr:transposable element Tcb2 transposase [Trichonephila clavipes]